MRESSTRFAISFQTMRAASNVKVCGAALTALAYNYSVHGGAQLQNFGAHIVCKHDDSAQVLEIYCHSYARLSYENTFGLSNSAGANDKGRLFFVSHLLGVVYATGSKKKTKQNTLNTRGCSSWVPLNTRGGLTRTPHGKKQTLDARGCSFEYH